MYKLAKEWATQEEVKVVFSIGRDTLGEWVRKGWIKVQGGGKPGATRRYCCEDIDRVMTRDALGRGQLKVRGKKNA